MNDLGKTQQQLVKELTELRHRVEELVQEQSTLKRAEKTRRVLAILSHKLSAAVAPKDAARLAGEAADELLGWDAFFVNMYSEAENLAYSIINIDTVNGVRKEFPSLYGEPGKPSPMLLRTLREGAQLILRQELDGSDGPNLTTFGENSRRSVSLMFAPIREKGVKNIGLLSIQSYKMNAYDAQALELLQSLADQCGSALDRTYAEEKLRQSEKRNAILAALASQLNSIASVKEAGKVIVEAAKKLFGWDSCFVTLYSEEKNLLAPAFNMDLIDGLCVEVPSDAFKGKPIGYTQRTIKEGKQLILRSQGSEPEAASIPFGDTSRRSASLMFVPILDGGHVIGVLSIQSYAANAYTREDLNLFESLAQHCGGALSRIQAEERAMAFAALGEKLGAVATPREAALVIANTADEILGWDSCFIRSYSAEDNVLHRILGFDIVDGKRTEIPSMGSTRPTALIARTIREGKFLILRDHPSQDVGSTRIGNLSRPSASLMFVPMRRGGKTVGVLSIQSYTPRAYTEKSLETLQALADHCSGALDRIQAEARIKTFSSLGARLNLASTPLEAARLIIETADQLLGWDCCYLYTYSASDNLIHPILVMDILDGQRTELPNPETGEPGPLISRALREGGFLLQAKDSIGSAAAEPIGDVARRSASLLLVPIRKGDRIIGVLSIQSYTPDQYSAEDLNTLQTLADYGGGALDRIQAEIALSESEERYALAMRGANDGIWDWNLKTDEIYFSPRWKTILGFEEHEIQYAPEEWFSRVHGEDLNSLKESLEAHCAGVVPHFENEHRILHKDGEYRWVLSRGLAIRDPKGEATRMAGSLTDIALRKAAEEKLRHSALCDALTNLPNRNLFLAHLTHALERQKRRPNYLLAVLFLDLDRFKVVNDSLGHEIGDKLLIGIGSRIKTCIRPMDTVARLGGDEFCVLVDDIKETSDALRIAERIHRELAKPFRLDGNDVFTGVSIGIAVSKNGQQRPEDLVRDADTAMYRAKALGRGHHQVFDPTMHTNAVALLKLETDLRLAVERQEFRLHYQPILSLETGRVIGFEALLRWLHPERGLLLPAEFLSLAEDTGLILPIGRWTLRKACQEAFVWQTAHPADPPLFISVNLSAREFAQKNLDVEVARILKETGLNPRSLIIEITESVVMENVESTARMLAKLKALDIQLHVDDFGTGYSSLSYLHRFPIDALKIDHLFIGAMGVSGEDSEIVRTIIGLARGLGMGIVAEGIESSEQLTELRKHHCPSGQGFLFSHPVPAEQVEAILQENKTSAQRYPPTP